MFQQLLQRYARYCSFPIAAYGEANFRVTGEVRYTLRDLPYEEQWRTSLTNGWYHVRLEDHSLFVFDVDPVRPSYAFLDSPIDVQTFREFLEIRGLPYDSRTRSEYGEMYQLELVSAPLRQRVTPIRYDFDAAAYHSGVHPIAHMHIGLDNAIRIAARRAFTPSAFFLFVMRQMYPHFWARLNDKLSDGVLERVVRTSLTPIADVHFGPRDCATAYLA